METNKDVEEIISTYNSVVKVVDYDAKNQNERAYGGMVRELKGHMQEWITEQIVKIAWKELGGKLQDLEINSKKIAIPIQKDYVSKIDNLTVKNFIMENIESYKYGLSVDKHIFIKGRFVIGIECKAYTENAMLKRILVDFHLLHNIFPGLSCYLFQLESQLTGDYSKLNEITYGSKSTHTLMSYFSDVQLHIFTFLAGERIVNQPIHEEKYFKELTNKQIRKAIDLLKKEMKNYL